MPPCPAAVGDGVIEGSEVGERRRWAFLCRVAQMLVEPAMRRLPRRLIRRSEPLAEPFAHQRVGVERIGTGWIDRRQQPHVAQAFDGATPLLLGEVSERVGQSRYRRFDARRPESAAQTRNPSPPRAFAKFDKRPGRPRNRRLATQRLQTIAARGPVEQADAMEDGEQDRLTGEPFLFSTIPSPAARDRAADRRRRQAGEYDRAGARRRSAFP